MTRRIPEAGPQAMHKPGRGDASVRDLIWACLILVPVALLIFSVGGSCSFSPGGPAEDAASAPASTPRARIAEYARGSTFPLRAAGRAGFRPGQLHRSSWPGRGRRHRRASGFVTPDADFLSLRPDRRVGRGRPRHRVRLRGARRRPPRRCAAPCRRGGLTWEVYGAEGGEPFRVATLPGRPEVRVLVTGSASEDQFRTLADALTTARVFPPGS
ncbi:DUF4245 family protein [Pseudonocardia sp. ICBG601]|uniref:DUF4245 family protein n=1 Tax=Pseudonocardia sp. ICBG601 TaxID=2846759 RepID=UPI001CF60FBE|nr:DUF4245 family protein [Pseudonocardia sp. ICBG601]